MGVMNIIGRPRGIDWIEWTAGHTEHKWDSDNSTEVEIARDLYTRLTAQGYRAFNMEDGERGPPMQSFDPNAEEMMFMKQPVGG